MLLQGYRQPRRVARATASLGLILFGVLLSAAPAASQVAPTINISNSPNLYSTSPRIATDSKGDVHAVWVEQPIGADQESVRNGDVYYAVGSRGTLQITVPVNISNVNTVWCSTLEMCSIDIDGSDRVYVVWTEGSRVKLRIKTGTVWDSGFDVASGPVYDAPRIAVTPNGDIFIIYWTNEGHVFSRARINGVWEDEKNVGRWDYRTKLADIAVGTSFIGAAWVERPSADQDANYQTAYAQRARTYNAAWSDSVQVAPSNENQQHAAVELDSSDAPHVVWTNEAGGQRIVYHARGNGSSFQGAAAISPSELLHYPFVAEGGDDLFACWQVGNYRLGSSIDFNSRENGVWKGVAAVPHSDGSTYADIAVTPDLGILFIVWDVDTIAFHGEIFGWAKALTIVKTISGTVRRNGTALPNVVMAGLPGNPATNASGQYASTVAAGWTGMVTPTLAGHEFTPGSRSYAGVFINQTEQDYSAVQAVQATLTVTSPNGGEILAYGSNAHITWASTGTVGDVKIEYSANGGTSWTAVIASTPNDGVHTWTVPATATTQGLIRVSDAGNPAIQDASNAVFTIAVPGSRKHDVLGTWTGQGVYYRNSDTGAWVLMESSSASQAVAGDLDGDGTDDLIGVFPGDPGVWVKRSGTGTWLKLDSVSPAWIAAGDMNGDGRDDLLGSWTGSGVYYKNSVTGFWVLMERSSASQVAAGDLDGDGTDDLIGVFPGDPGVWVKRSGSGTWLKLDSVSPAWIAAGDMNGDGRDDLLGSWTGSGVYYKNSVTGFWVLMERSSASQVAAGDLDGDGTDDLIGVFPDDPGVWVKQSGTRTWLKLDSVSPAWIAAGRMRDIGGGAGQEMGSVRPFWLGSTGFVKEGAYEDRTMEGPHGRYRWWTIEANAWVGIPLAEEEQRRINPGPGEPGFRPDIEKNADGRKGASAGRMIR